MMISFVSQCEKKALSRTRRVLDRFANRIGDNTWQTVITNEGLNAVKKLLRKTASKNTAVSCFWIRSRSRSDLVWVVGNRDRFNSEGVVPVNYTQQNILKASNEEGWTFLPAIEALTVFSALLHDFGKTTKLFQDKLKGKNKIQSDPLRHEWVSILFLIAIVNNKSDEEWLDYLISDEIHKNIAKLKINDSSNPLDGLPPIASMVAWLILRHHKLPILDEKKYAGKDIKLSTLFSLISSVKIEENRRQSPYRQSRTLTQDINHVI